MIISDPMVKPTWKKDAACVCIVQNPSPRPKNDLTGLCKQRARVVFGNHAKIEDSFRERSRRERLHCAVSEVSNLTVSRFGWLFGWGWLFRRGLGRRVINDPR